MVPSLSTSSSSGSHHSTSRTLSRQERHCSTSSSSSSSSPTTATSSDSETRERKDRTESDTSPVHVSSSDVDDRTGRPVVCRESNHEQGRQANQKPQTPPKTNKKETMIERGHPLFADSRRASSEIPEWLQEFRENLVDDEVPEHRDSHTSSSHDPSLESTPTRSADLGKHSVYTHFPKDRNCEICQRTKITRAPVQKTHWRSRTSCRKFWLFDKNDMQSWCRTWPPNGFSRIGAKQKLLRKHKGACKSSWSQIGSLKSFTLTFPWNLAKPVKIFPGIIVRLHNTDQKQMGLLREQCAE